MLRIERVLTRADGTEVRITAHDYIGAGMTRLVGVNIYRRRSPGEDWVKLSPDPAYGWKAMTVQEYLEKGRPESMQVVSHGEVLSLLSTLKCLSVA